MLRLCVFCFATFFVASGLRASSYFGTLDSTQEENEQLRGIFLAMPYGHSSTLTSCESVLKVNPKNRHARLIRAQTLLQVGRVVECKTELGYLQTNFPNFAPTYDALALVAFAQDDQKGALAAYKKRLQIKPADPTLAMLAESSKGWYETRILELEGKINDAENALLAKPLAEGKPYVRAIAAETLAEFYSRQRKLTEAVKQLESAVATRRASRDPNVSSQVLLATVRWAQGKRTEALKSMIATAEDILDERISDRESLCKAVLSAHVLTQRGTGTAQDKEKVSKLLREAAELFPDTLQYCMEDPLLALGGKTKVEDSIGRTRTVFKEASHIEWALWSALFLGLDESTKSGQLLQLLPEGTLQKQIADVEKKK